jgi:hypothetical protein
MQSTTSERGEGVRTFSGHRRFSPVEHVNATCAPTRSSQPRSGWVPRHRHLAGQYVNRRDPLRAAQPLARSTRWRARANGAALSRRQRSGSIRSSRRCRGTRSWPRQPVWLRRGGRAGAAWPASTLASPMRVLRFFRSRTGPAGQRRQRRGEHLRLGGATQSRYAQSGQARLTDARRGGASGSPRCGTDGRIAFRATSPRAGYGVCARPGRRAQRIVALTSNSTNRAGAGPVADTVARDEPLQTQICAEGLNTPDMAGSKLCLKARLTPPQLADRLRARRCLG